MAQIEDSKKPEEDQPQIPLTVEFSGGLELLFDNERKLSLSLPTVKGTESANISYLVEYLCNNMMTDSRRDMFILDGSIRPGILVLINDADWELEGGADYEIQPKDNILFVSTLHGG